MWLVIFAVSILSGVAGLIYLAHKTGRSGLFDRIESRALSKLAAYAAVALIVALLVFVFDVTNTIVIVIHVAVFLLAGDLVRVIASRVTDAGLSSRIFDLCAVSICFIYLLTGWYLMHGLWESDYTLLTGKHTGELRIAQIADSHIGCGFSGEGFAKRLAKIQETQPDVLVITGDFVDDDTMKQDMLDACAALGDFSAKYGIFFCFGNHDKGYYSKERRGYGSEELKAELERNGVTVLEDESILIDDRFYIIGREDAGYGDSKRKAMSELTEGLDNDKYMIVLDHQPVDYDAEEAAGVDLVLSGHTHGGQLFPLEYIQPLVSSNNAVRGLTHRGNTDFIVTDGISDWAIKFKTGCRSEYNLITVKEQ